MADRHLVRPLTVRFSPEDDEWLAKLAKNQGTSPHTVVKRAVRFFRSWQADENIVEAASMAAYFLRVYQKQVRRQCWLEREYQMQSRRLHEQRRTYQKRLWQEQNLLRAYQKRLWDEQDLRRAYERQLQRQRSCGDRQATASTEANRGALYSPTVARLLALAVCSESDGEAKAAFTKARTLHRLQALTHARLSRPPGGVVRTGHDLADTAGRGAGVPLRWAAYAHPGRPGRQAVWVRRHGANHPRSLRWADPACA